MYCCSLLHQYHHAEFHQFSIQLFIIKNNKKTEKNRRKGSSQKPKFNTTSFNNQNHSATTTRIYISILSQFQLHILVISCTVPSLYSEAHHPVDRIMTVSVQ
jgi:hypothetical protein